MDDKNLFEELIPKDNRESDEQTTTKNIKNINSSMIFLVIIACGYSVLFVIMVININGMTNNLNRIVNYMDTIQSKQLNTTIIENMQRDFTLVKDCVLHKYCKRVPD
jgi:type IV secretory pathway component VirB8